MQGYNTSPIVIGNEANYIQESQRLSPELTHEWRCFVRAPSGLVKAVQFKLHESFKNPYVNVTEEPFEIREKGWGEFTIQIKITLFNDEKVSTTHYLKLHGSQYPLISEKADTVAFKGSSIEIDPSFKYTYEHDNEEYKRIDDAINHVLSLLDTQRKSTN